MEKANSATSTTKPANSAKSRLAVRSHQLFVGRTVSVRTASFGETAGRATNNAANGRTENPIVNKVPMNRTMARMNRSRSFVTCARGSLVSAAAAGALLFSGIGFFVGIDSIDSHKKQFCFHS